ncbi:hypothetical protein AB0N73_04770 [Microbacterium sp. NPDC089189]|uniref:hypothetical protein n=1 Tax=Microbacterium sp. NPDC089189 TaxID=3154972 RepID=UPI00344882F9
MNTTNRILNRAVILIVGLILLAAGAVGVAGMVWPAASEVWTSTGDAVVGWVADAEQSTLIGDTAASWLGVAAVAALVLVIALLVWLIVGLFSRRSRMSHNGSTSDGAVKGRTIIREAFTADLVSASLADRADVLSARVTANDIRREPVLHVSVTPRPTSSPRDVADHVNDLVRNLHALSGTPTRTVISLHANLRSRLAGERRDLS